LSHPYQTRRTGRPASAAPLSARSYGPVQQHCLSHAGPGHVGQFLPAMFGLPAPARGWRCMPRIGLPTRTRAAYFGRRSRYSRPLQNASDSLVVR
jgi:hypothetical protein